MGSIRTPKTQGWPKSPPLWHVAFGAAVEKGSAGRAPRQGTPLAPPPQPKSSLLKHKLWVG